MCCSAFRWRRRGSRTSRPTATRSTFPKSSPTSRSTWRRPTSTTSTRSARAKSRTSNSSPTTAVAAVWAATWAPPRPTTSTPSSCDRHVSSRAGHAVTPRAVTSCLARRSRDGTMAYRASSHVANDDVIWSTKRMRRIGSYLWAGTMSIR